MYIFFVTTLIAICYILRTVNDNPIEISRHTENLTNDMVFAVLKTCSTLQKQYNQDIQFLLNSGALTIKDIRIVQIKGGKLNVIEVNYGSGWEEVKKIKTDKK